MIGVEGTGTKSINVDIEDSNASKSDLNDKIQKAQVYNASATPHELAEDFPIREVRFGSVIFNPIVSFIGAGLLWGLAIYCIVDPDASATLAAGQTWVSDTFTWLYIGTQDVWIIFLIYVYIYYGDRKLGANHEKPEFDDATYFMMIFCAGIGVGLFFFGVSEPLWHYTGGNRYNANSAATPNEVSQDAINLTVFHWGIHGWVVYSFLACLLGFMSYRKGLPLTIRSCFYPLLGDHTWGWIGDVIDGISIVTIVSGVCTSLGLGAKQVLGGMVYIGIIDESVLEDEDQTMTASIIIICCITFVATLSVVSGLNKGIKLLSQFAFGLGIFLLAAVFFLDQTWFLLNLMVQSTGYYFQWFIQLGFFTDAFAQLKPLEGQSIDPEESASASWMASWTIFYYGWWISWASFVGTFLARISRGRTIRQVFNFTMTVPLVFVLVWFSVFGGAGLRMHRRAQELQQLGETRHGDEDYFLVSTSCYAIPEEYNTTGLENTWDHNISPVCISIGTNSWFDTLNQYAGVGTFLSVVSIVALIVYFVTSSDSGSLVVDTLAANGREEQHVIQRIFWAVTEGALAIALLVGGGSSGGGLTALQAASIIAGLPYTVFLSMMTTCFWRVLKFDKESELVEDEAHHMHLKHWNVFGPRQFDMPIHGGVLDIFEFIFGGGKIAEGRGAKMPTSQMYVDFVVSVFAPFVSIMQVLKAENGKRGVGQINETYVDMGSICGNQTLFNNLFSVVLASMFYCATIMMIGANNGFGANFVYLGLTFYCVFACMLAYVRFVIRNKYNILGNIVEDFFSGFFLYPQLCGQLAIHAREATPTPVS